MAALSPYTQAALLLAAHLGKTTKGAPNPLSPTEWERVTAWLRERGIPLPALLRDAGEILEGWNNQRITVERMVALLGRGAALGVAAEKWERSGIWVISDAAPDYPRNLRMKLSGRAPAVLFGCGNRQLLNAKCWAVVGSRSASGEDLRFSTQLGAKAAGSGTALISGGARGVDDAAMEGALAAEGTGIGILADSLLKAVLSRKYRDPLQRKDLLLLSPFYPEAGFSTGNAMGRNKYVYCMAELAVVVHSGTSGGTWAGANEAIKKEYCPVWVKRTDDPDAGNAALVERGAQWLEDDVPIDGGESSPTGGSRTEMGKPSSRRDPGDQLSIFGDGSEPGS